MENSPHICTYDDYIYYIPDYNCDSSDQGPATKNVKYFLDPQCVNKNKLSSSTIKTEICCPINHQNYSYQDCLRQDDGTFQRYLEPINPYCPEIYEPCTIDPYVPTGFVYIYDYTGTQCTSNTESGVLTNWYGCGDKYRYGFKVNYDAFKKWFIQPTEIVDEYYIYSITEDITVQVIIDENDIFRPAGSGTPIMTELKNSKDAKIFIIKPFQTLDGNYLYTIQNKFNHRFCSSINNITTDSLLMGAGYLEEKDILCNVVNPGQSELFNIVPINSNICTESDYNIEICKNGILSYAPDYNNCNPGNQYELKTNIGCVNLSNGKIGLQN